MIEEESSERMFRIILLSNQKRISLQAVFLLTNLLYEEKKNMKENKVTFLTQAAMIAAIYVVLTYVFAPFSFGEIQIRISEALTILPLFTPAAIPGLFIGCLIGNILGGAILPDIIF